MERDVATPPAPGQAGGAGRTVRARVLTADLAGLRNQALGLAEAAGFDIDLRIVAPRGIWRHLSPGLWPRGARRIAPSAAEPPEGDLLIGCGGAASRVVADLRRRDLPAVAIQNPRMALSRFDAVVAAPHDGISGPNVIVVRNAIHRVTPSRLDEARLAWEPVFAHLPRPRVAVLVGGSNGRHRLEREDAARLAEDLAGMMRRDAVGLMVTPSRRTHREARAILKAALEPLGAYVWDLEGENPYFGMLACADAVIVTADSVSMVSEAAATPVPVLLARLPGRSGRIDSFMEGMRNAGRARDFAGRFEDWPVTPLNDTPEAAAEIRRRLGL